MSLRPDPEYSVGSRIGVGDWVWSEASRRRLKPMHRVANRRRDRKVDLGSKSEAGYQQPPQRKWWHSGESDDTQYRVPVVTCPGAPPSP
jgi:hypothetical protein